MKMPEFDNETLNIFTDASIVQIDSGEYVSCSGATAYSGKIDETRLIDEIFQINYDSTNNNGEIIAIQKGIGLALKHRAEYKQFNLFSDSKICIYGLREWIKNWVEKSEDGVLIGSTNTPISNQGVIMACVSMILDNNLPIKLYHQKGHADDRKLSKSVQTFKNSNHIDTYVTNEFIHEINENNDYVDTKSRDILTVSATHGYPQVKPIDLVTRVYDPNIDIDGYLALVNN